MKLCEMAQEYRVNVALLELRIKQLQAAQKRARQPEVRYRLKQRAKFLQTLINESRQTVFLMEHYHDHSEEGDAHADCRAVLAHSDTAGLPAVSRSARGGRPRLPAGIPHGLLPGHARAADTAAVRGAVDDRGGGIILQTVR